ncbi:single-stranded DNA-binding protein [Anaerocolumna xylanovorans]|uniref:Single-stranded DNA-binding protein n=1 Tax=Anaerocolumna xylanovorans DSM 12503 TaxID=1121345 RepID=A0A1M7YBW0_9FIRM|nr:single-stranded DNA-binding protein [Anaerocolumna xylanovorans]SHO50132.1 single-strand DNA-binding protein [Anaerocolumna xylanovorans DSM 12503]
MNKWIGSGTVSEEPVIRYDGDKASFVAFTIMTKRNTKYEEGKQMVDFVDCKCIGHNAEFAKNYLRKGKKIEVTGPLQSGFYKNKDGAKVYTKTVLVEELVFAETKAEEDARKETEQTPPPAAPDNSFMEIPEGIDQEMPFN